MTDGLELRGLVAGYGPVEVLHGIDASFPAGSIIAVIGRNGAGTSTLLRCISGLVAPRSGSVMWEGRDIGGLTGYRRARAGLLFVSDEHNVFASLTVEENLHLFGRPTDPAECVRAACALFPELEPLLAQRAGVLSGGERQMLALARTVIRPARLLLLDEASRGLSADVAERYFDHLRTLRSPDRVIVVAEQFVDSVLAIADLVHVMRRGSIAFTGTPNQCTDEVLARSMH